MKIVLNESPNQSQRIHGDAAVKLIVCHTPEGAYEPMVKYMTDPTQSRKVSYHQLINETGTEVTQLVPFSRKAWHAGPVNSLSDGISAAGFARSFNPLSPQADVFAGLVASRLVARGLKPQWTTDPAKGGFCRHADLQTDRSDPMSLDKWLVFVGMVEMKYQGLTSSRKPWPIPVPAWFWPWASWKLRGSPAGQRPKTAPAPGLSWAPGGKHAWAWKRLKALQDARKNS